MEEIGRIVRIDSLGKYGTITGIIEPNKYYILLSDGSTLAIEKARLTYTNLEVTCIHKFLDCLLVLDNMLKGGV